ncbi:F-box only protein 21-like [Vespa mandarinia]|uniref:F-box only protein 21-like n=1 Tax=Vespa mandarinia TaxID=7446 RepID=UPI00161EA0C4|nr:F-box only protein 21-like [Vespa mandarinia]XP_035717526.1 F-box only protein 21-like [Vespa mandarinia]XP_035717535.1 F-box only protein 21-like [Vespa mandarinia]
MAAYIITLLPGEIIEYILEDPNITFLDIVRFSITCKHFYQIVKDNNKLWRVKYFQRWPLLKEHYKENSVDLKVFNWLNEIQISITIRRSLMQHLSLMSTKHYKREELSHSELRYFDPLFRPEQGAHQLSYHFLVDELISLINRPIVDSNLTHRYYAFIVLRYLRQNYLTEEWQRFIHFPPDEQILEKGATIVAQWSQPERHISYSYISSLLDDIANQAKNLLYEKYPKHSIFSLSAEQLLIWKNRNINDNQWSTSETRQIMEALCEVLFQNLGFYGSSEMYYSSENSFIDRVLEGKHGIPMILAIIFESIARRLGVRCEPVSFPSHFLLRWKEKYNVTEPESIESFYIDVLNGGQFLTKENCPKIGGISKCPIAKYNLHNPATAVEVVKRMAYNLDIAARQHIHLNGRASRIRSALELNYMMQPYDKTTILNLGRFYMIHHMDISELMLQNMQKDLETREQANLIQPMLQMIRNPCKPEEETEPKWRIPNVKYAVGLIMTHKTDGNLCVITGWNKPYDPDDSRNQLQECTNLEQPYYNALVDDGSSSYIPQDLLSFPSKPRLINHYKIGRYFSYFKGTHYVPNEETSTKYPEDEEALNNILQYYLN